MNKKNLLKDIGFSDEFLSQLENQNFTNDFNSETVINFNPIVQNWTSDTNQLQVYETQSSTDRLYIK
ncbi:hypothetical protein [Maribacter sp. 1_MG-2023]|uniref:hypothetical protein n=1 Tax=Maribacter sp. 1_MG-2023 TaxID=3062677 RepID=UPI0026E15B09|nr:hypothetical protein [Maribacter sp. 1_MG-2023]MDO6473609.1 hypothetical protein [Maribacter sp. 1_MG-2023]